MNEETEHQIAVLFHVLEAGSQVWQSEKWPRSFCSREVLCGMMFSVEMAWGLDPCEAVSLPPETPGWVVIEFFSVTSDRLDLMKPSLNNRDVDLRALTWPTSEEGETAQLFVCTNRWVALVDQHVIDGDETQTMRAVSPEGPMPQRWLSPSLCGGSV